MKIERILVPTDFSEDSCAALETALAFARQLGAGVYLLHIQSENTLRTAIKEELFGPQSTDEELREAVAQLLETRFSEMCAGLGESPVPLQHLVRLGEPKSAILEYAVEIQADLLVVARHGAGTIGRIGSALLGSVAEHLIEYSPCPVLITRYPAASRH